jgi:integrase
MAEEKRTRNGGRKSYVEPRECDTWRHEALQGEERWQQDWHSDEEAGMEATAERRRGQAAVKDRQQEQKEGDKKEKTRGKESARRKRKRESIREPEEQIQGRREQTKEQRRQTVLEFIERNRNANTAATYTSAWKQFGVWCEEVENPRRAAGERITVDRPDEEDIAAYMQYLVMEKGHTMASVTAAKSAIADRLKYVTSQTYDPCRGKVVEAMQKVLLTMVEPARQKRELDWETMRRIADRTKEAVKGEPASIPMRDRCMILLAYFAFLRTSEVARMRREDVEITRERIENKEVKVLRVYVDSSCKNDIERKGHERLIAEREKEEDICIVRAMEEWLGATAGRTKESPLFPTEEGKEMSADTPRGRLKEWLRTVGVKEANEYGFHSLRAGAATEAARAGVEERLIKLHGNWKSDAVRVYMRAGVEERLQASNVLGRTNR